MEAGPPLLAISAHRKVPLCAGQVAATDPASASSAESEAEAESGAEAGPSDADSVASEHSFSRSATGVQTVASVNTIKEVLSFVFDEAANCTSGRPADSTFAYAGAESISESWNRLVSGRNINPKCPTRKYPRAAAPPFRTAMAAFLVEALPVCDQPRWCPCRCWRGIASCRHRDLPPPSGGRGGAVSLSQSPRSGLEGAGTVPAAAPRFPGPSQRCIP